MKQLYFFLIKFTSNALLLFMLCSAWSSSWAQVTNTSCATAIELECNSSDWYGFSGTTNQRTWFKLSGNDQFFDVKICHNGPPFGYFYREGGCGSNDFPTYLTSRVPCTTNGRGEEFTLFGEQGIDYYFFGQSFGFNTPGTWSQLITVDCVEPNLNSFCEDAIPINCGDEITGDTRFSIPDPTLMFLNIPIYGQWYTFVGDGNIARLSISVEDGLPFVILGQGSCGNLDPDFSSAIYNQGSYTQSILTIPGETYYVLAYEAEGAPFTLNFDCCAPPAVSCKDISISVSPDAPTILNAGDLIASSSADCGLNNINLSQTEFDCTFPAGDYDVTVTITDDTGVQDDCVSTVTVQPLNPAQLNCQDATLYLSESNPISLKPSDVLAPITKTERAIQAQFFSRGNGPVSNNDFTVPITEAQTVFFDVSLETTSSSNFAEAGYLLNGTFMPFAIAGTGLDAGVREIAVSVNPGDVFGFRFRIDNTQFGIAEFLVSAFLPGFYDQFDPNNWTTSLSNNGFFKDIQIFNGIEQETYDINLQCGIASLNFSQLSFTDADLGTNTITITATDEEGDQLTCTPKVTIEGGLPGPTINCKNVSIQLDDNGMASLSANAFDNGTTAINGGTISFSFDQAGSMSSMDFECTDLGTNSITIYARETDSGISSCAPTLSVLDEVAPTAICQDVSLNLSAGSLSASALDAGSNDNCTANNELGFSLSLSGQPIGANVDLTCNEVGVFTAMLTVADASGNTSDCVAIVTVADDEAPNAICVSSFTATLSGNIATISTSDINNGSTDNCMITSLSLSETTFSCCNLGTFDISLTVTDNSNNSSTCTTSLTVEDNTPPTAMCENLTVELDGNGVGTITASEIGGGSSDACGAVSLQLDNSSFDCGNLGGNNTVTLTVTDLAGNSSSCTASITVEDKLSPTLVCTNQTVKLSSPSINAMAIITGSTDNCGGFSNLTVNTTSYTYTCNDIGTQSETLLVTDEQGNSASCTVDITVEDDIAPTAVCNNATVQLDANGEGSISASEIGSASTDNCTIASLSLDNNTFSCTDLGNCNMATLTVTDLDNNISTCTATITVENNITPTAQCKTSVDFELTSDATTILLPDMIDDGSFNGCGDFTFSLSQNEFDCDDVNNAIITILTITDNENNLSSSCQTTVNVIDPNAFCCPPPVAVCNDVMVELDANGIGSTTAAIVGAGSFATCGLLSETISQSSFDCSDIGSTTVTYTMADINNEQASCTSNIQVVLGNSLPDGWSTNDVGAITIGNEYSFDPCLNLANGVFTVTGSGNNITSSTTDNVAFASQTLCGDGSITAKIESITSDGYGGLMIRETTDAGAKQVAIFSNLSSILRHETRYTTNEPKQINSFFKPSPFWLRLERQGDWVFAYYSTTGASFSYVHGVFVPMQSCIEIGLASFTQLTYAQTEAVFSNVTVSGNNSGFSVNNTATPQHFNTTTSTTYTISPNPASNEFIVQLSSPTEKTKTLELYNTFGQLIEIQALSIGKKKLTWDVRALPSGTYWLKSKNQNQLDKIIVSH